MARFDYEYLKWWYTNTKIGLPSKQIDDLNRKYKTETKNECPYEVYTLSEFEEGCKYVENGESKGITKLLFILERRKRSRRRIGRGYSLL